MQLTSLLFSADTPCPMKIYTHFEKKLYTCQIHMTLLDMPNRHRHRGIHTKILLYNHVFSETSFALPTSIVKVRGTWVREEKRRERK